MDEIAFDNTLVHFTTWRHRQGRTRTRAWLPQNPAFTHIPSTRIHVSRIHVSRESQTPRLSRLFSFVPVLFHLSWTTPILGTVPQILVLARHVPKAAKTSIMASRSRPMRIDDRPTPDLASWKISNGHMTVSDSITSTCCGYVVQQAVRQIHNRLKANSKSTTNSHQVACNNQQVLQQVAQLVVQQIHRSSKYRESDAISAISRPTHFMFASGWRLPDNAQGLHRLITIGL